MKRHSRQFDDLIPFAWPIKTLRSMMTSTSHSDWDYAPFNFKQPFSRDPHMFGMSRKLSEGHCSISLGWDALD